MRPTRRNPVHVVVAVSATLALAACSHGTASTGGMDHGSMSTAPHPSSAGPRESTSAQAASGDVMFAQMMIPHHQQAVEMADLALKKPDTSAEVRALAEQIRAAQAPEIATMAGWLTTWGAPPAGGSEHIGHGTDGMMTEADMSALADADGASFDRMWLTMMIAHHEGAVTMSRAVLSTTADARVRALAEAIVTAQQQEIAHVRGLSS